MRATIGTRVATLALAMMALAACSGHPSPAATTPSTSTRPPGCADIDRQVLPLMTATTDGMGQTTPPATADLRIAARIIVDHKKCYDATTVAQAEEYLR